MVRAPGDSPDVATCEDHRPRKDLLDESKTSASSSSSPTPLHVALSHWDLEQSGLCNLEPFSELKEDTGPGGTLCYSHLSSLEAKTWALV